MENRYNSKPKSRPDESNSFNEKLERFEEAVKYRLEHPKFLEDGPPVYEEAKEGDYID